MRCVNHRSNGSAGTIDLEQLWPAKPKVEHLKFHEGERLRNVLVIGHGDLVRRQRPSFELWQNQEVEIAYADISAEALDRRIKDTSGFKLPDDTSAIFDKAHGLPGHKFDLVLINSVPEDHLASALKYSAIARNIIIQKPQDLNFPLIETICQGKSHQDLVKMSFVYDHYRNKGIFPALLEVLPEQMAKFGRIHRMLVFLTEAKDVNSEEHRKGSLQCGMIQDLGVHVMDLLLETLLFVDHWRFRTDSDQTEKMVGGIVDLKSCVRSRQQMSRLGDEVETFAALDIEVTQVLSSPYDRNGRRTKEKSRTAYEHKFDVLIVLGKGVFPTHSDPRDLKSIAIEFDRPKSSVVCDLGALAFGSGVTHSDLNNLHGGLNRPLMLLAPTPPEHAVKGSGGLKYAQWQTFALARHVAYLAHCAQHDHATPGLRGYPHGRPIDDYLAEFAREGVIRPTWGDLGNLTTYSVLQKRPEGYID